MKRRLSQPAAKEFTFQYNGENVPAVPGDTLASALLAAGVDVFSRSIKYHRPRGAFCLSGRCAHCLVRVDGRPDEMACATPAAPGLSVTAQNSFPSAKHDVLAAIDWMFPKGLDHHSMFAGIPVVEGAVAKVARHIAGLGPLPDHAAAPGPAPEKLDCEVAIVGAGPAGLACARELRGAGRSVVVLDERPLAGGRLLGGLDSPPDPDWTWAEKTRAECEQGGVRFVTGATVLAVYRDEGPRFLAIRLRDPERLALVQARQLVFCNGAIEPIEPFEENDMPGIYAGRGLARLVKQQKVLPGEHAAIVGSGQEVVALARLLAVSGARVAALVDPTGTLRTTEFRVLSGFRPHSASGRGTVRSLLVQDAQGHRESLACDLVALCGQPAPAIELPRQAGAFVSYRRDLGGYYVETRDGGRTTAEGVWAAGDVTGAGTAQKAREQGEATGRALAATLS